MIIMTKTTFQSSSPCLFALADDVTVELDATHVEDEQIEMEIHASDVDVVTIEEDVDEVVYKEEEEEVVQDEVISEIEEEKEEEEEKDSVPETVTSESDSVSDSESETKVASQNVFQKIQTSFVNQLKGDDSVASKVKKIAAAGVGVWGVAKMI